MPDSRPARIRIGDCEIDAAAFVLRCGGRVRQVEPQVLELLLYLARNPDRLITKDDLIRNVWGGRIVSDATLASRIRSARQAVGDDGQQQRLIRTVHGRGVRLVGDATESPDAAAAVGTAPDGARPEVGFCRTADGVSIAYSVAGSGTPLVKAAHWLTHLEFDWNSPIWRPLLAEFARDRRLVRYDGRGTGLSDWQVEDISFEAFVRDIETVVDALDLERFALLGISQGCAASIAYAVRHPERVSHLILLGGYAKGWRRRADVQEIRRREALVTLIRDGWDTDAIAFRDVFTSLFVPHSDEEQRRWWTELVRVSSSPANAARLVEAFGEIDVAELLPRVAAPTLVLHSRHEAVVPFSAGRQLAIGIPGARFVSLDSRNHIVLAQEPAWRDFIAEIRTFLDGAPASRAEA
jgi:pimeloyl-ACP methyl ester carboxylesterase/DNA-binding winged helix-turn-helix (wHTH) protein